jgi:hypothetical protein
MKAFIVLLLLAAQASTTGVLVVPSAKARALVTPFLDLRSQAESSTGAQQQSEFEQSEKILARLFRMKTPASDEALVVLMNYYVGEALGPDSVHEVTVRGKRMLPLLLRYRKATVSFPDRTYPPSLSVERDIRERNFETAIKSIKEGKVFGEE